MPFVKKKRRSKSKKTCPRSFAKWNNESMEAAIEQVRKGTMSLTKAAKFHGVPSTTLKDRMSGKVVHGSKPGQKWYLTDEEEDALANHLIEAASIGYGKTHAEVKSLTEKIAIEKNILLKDQVTDGWWHRFKERQPKLSLRRGDPTAHVRMDSTNKKKQFVLTIISLKKRCKRTTCHIVQHKFTIWTKQECPWIPTLLMLWKYVIKRKFVTEYQEKRSK